MENNKFKITWQCIIFKGLHLHAFYIVVRFIVPGLHAFLVEISTQLQLLVSSGSTYEAFFPGYQAKRKKRLQRTIKSVYKPSSSFFSVLKEVVAMWKRRVTAPSMRTLRSQIMTVYTFLFYLYPSIIPIATCTCTRLTCLQM